MGFNFPLNVALEKSGGAGGLEPTIRNARAKNDNETIKGELLAEAQLAQRAGADPEAPEMSWECVRMRKVGVSKSAGPRSNLTPMRALSTACQEYPWTIRDYEDRRGAVKAVCRLVSEDGRLQWFAGQMRDSIEGSRSAVQ